MNTTTDLPEGVYDTFTYPCTVCGAPVHVKDGAPLPHRCRIEIPEKP